MSMKHWEWGDTGLLLSVLFIMGLLGLCTYAGFQNHAVQFYYMSDHGQYQNSNGYCINGYRYWYFNDQGVFCSDDIQKTLNVLKQMNESLLRGIQK